MIQGKLLSYGDDLSQVFEIRTKVFVDELGNTKADEFDFLDSEAIHVLVYEEKISENREDLSPVAVGRITYDGEVCEISHLAVLKEHRRKEYGDFALRMLVNRALITGIDQIILYSPTDIVGFFEKVGFVLSDLKEEEQKNNRKMVLDLNKICTMCHCKH